MTIPKLQLKEISWLIMGQSPPSSTYNSVGEGLPFFQGKTDFGEMYPTVTTHCSQPVRIAQPNDILMSVRAPVGPTNISNTECCIGRGLAAIRAKDEVDTNYLLYFFKFAEPKISGQARGSTFDAITRYDLEELLVPLPDLETQRRIASTLSKADRLRRLRRYALEISDTFLQGVFLEVFGRPRDNSNWETLHIGDVAEIIVPTRDKPKRFVGKIPWVTLPDVQSFFVSSAQNLLTHEDAEEVGNRLMPTETVLLSCAGSLGRVAITTQEVYANQQFYGLVCDPSKINNLFLAQYLKLLGEAFYFDLAGVSTLAFFSKEKALGIDIILPPLELQQHFARIVRKHEWLRAQQMEALRQAEHLYQTLLHQAFGGQ